MPISDVPGAGSSAKVESAEARPAGDEQDSPGSSGESAEQAVGYAVRELPVGRKAWIRQEHGKCHMLLEGRNGETEWLGEFSSLEDALQALSDRLMPGMFL